MAITGDDERVKARAILVSPVAHLCYGGEANFPKRVLICFEVITKVDNLVANVLALVELTDFELPPLLANERHSLLEAERSHVFQSFSVGQICITRLGFYRSTFSVDPILIAMVLLGKLQ